MEFLLHLLNHQDHRIVFQIQINPVAKHVFNQVQNYCHQPTSVMLHQTVKTLTISVETFQMIPQSCLIQPIQHQNLFRAIRIRVQLYLTIVQDYTKNLQFQQERAAI